MPNGSIYTCIDTTCIYFTCKYRWFTEYNLLKLQLCKANYSDTEVPFLDLNLSIRNGIVSKKIYMINGMILVLVFDCVLNYRFTALQLSIYKGGAMRDMCFRWPRGNIVYPIFETTLILCFDYVRGK